MFVENIYVLKINAPKYVQKELDFQRGASASHIETADCLSPQSYRRCREQLTVGYVNTFNIYQALADHWFTVTRCGYTKSVYISHAFRTGTLTRCRSTGESLSTELVSCQSVSICNYSHLERDTGSSLLMRFWLDAGKPLLFWR